MYVGVPTDPPLGTPVTGRPTYPPPPSRLPKVFAPGWGLEFEQAAPLGTNDATGWAGRDIMQRFLNNRGTVMQVYGCYAVFNVILRSSRSCFPSDNQVGSMGRWVEGEGAHGH